jgi:hypothetical protein
MKYVFATTALAFAICAVLIPRIVWAQYNYFSSVQFNSSVSTFIPHKLKFAEINADADKAARKSSTAKAENKVPPVAAEAPPIKASPNNNPLPYRRDQGLSNKIREEFLRDFAQQMPANEAAEMRTTVEQTDFVQVAAGFVQLQGISSATPEGLLALWYGQSWAILHQKPLPTRQQYQAIGIQVRAMLASTGTWGKMSNAERQTFFEQLAYPLIVQKANYQAYLKQNKADSISRMADATRAGMQKIGVDLQNLELGDKGLTSR